MHARRRTERTLGERGGVETHVNREQRDRLARATRIRDAFRRRY